MPVSKFYEVICSTVDRDAWLVERVRGIGSSDAPAILGVSPFRSALEVYADKLGAREDNGQTENQRWGLLVEPIIIEEFARDTGRECARSSSLIRSLARPWQLATLDAVQKDPKRETLGVLEAKWTRHRAEDWAEGLPIDVFVQLQHQLAVTGHAWGSAAVAIAGPPVLWADVERDDRFIEGVLLPAELEFLDRIARKIPPGPDGSESAKRALKALFPEDTGREVELGGEFIGIDAAFEHAKKRAAQFTEEAEEHAQKIKAAIGEASVGVLPNGVAYSYRLQHRAAFDVKASSYRVLRRSEPKGSRHHA